MSASRLRDGYDTWRTRAPDLSISLYSVDNSSNCLDFVKQTAGVADATLEYQLSGNSPYGYAPLRAIQPGNWVNVSFYEESWFTGSTLETALQQLATNNRTIILDQNLADYLNIQLGEDIAITIGSETYNLEVIAFFACKN